MSDFEDVERIDVISGILSPCKEGDAVWYEDYNELLEVYNKLKEGIEDLWRII